MRALVLAAAVVATACLVGLTTAPCTTRLQMIDGIIGRGEFNRVHPVTAGTPDDVHRQISERLVYLESLLRSRDVSAWPAALRAERLKNIERLRDYRLRGAFPINYDHPDRQLPCFLDRDGNLCAVANLIAESEGMELVKQINSRYQYATVAEMKMPDLDRWIAVSGLTREEVITIQEPGFTYARPLMRSEDSVQIIAQTDSTSLQLTADSTAPAVSAIQHSLQNSQYPEPTGR